MSRSQELQKLRKQLESIDSLLNTDRGKTDPKVSEQKSKEEELSELKLRLAEIDDFLDDGVQLKSKREPEVGLIGRTGQVVRGAAKTYGGIADLAHNAVLTGGVHEDIPRLPAFSEPSPETESGKKSIFQQRDELNDEIERQRQAGALNIDMSGKLASAVDSLYGQNLEPTDKTGKFLQGVGEFLAPVPGGPLVKAGKAGIKPFARELGKEAATASGISAALNVAPRVTQEGTGAGFLEDLGKTALGAKAGRALPRTAESVGRGLLNPLESGRRIATETQQAARALPGLAETVGRGLINPLESGRRLLAKGASKLIRPNQEILNTASRYDIELPFNVASGSTAANSFANNYLKSMFVSRAYKDSLSRASNSMINAVRRSIDTLGLDNIGPHAGSTEFSQYLRDQEPIFKRQADVLYRNAREHLTPNDNIVPRRTLERLRSGPVQELIDTISPSSSERGVINRIEQVAEGLGAPMQQRDIRAAMDAQNVNPRYLQEIMSSLDNNNTQVPVSRLIGLRRSLMNTLNYEPDTVRGSEAFLSGLIRSLDYDIMHVNNPEFLTAYRDANRFFRENIGQRFRKSIAVSLMRNEAPVEAYNLMNSVDNINRLERTAGQEPRGIEILNSLKKAKVREIIGNAVEGNLLGDGSIRTKPFAKIFQKKEPQQELLHKLLGNEQYNNLCYISTVSDEFSRAGTELLNTSGTYHVTSDMNLAKDVSNQVIKSLSFIAGHGAAGGSLGSAGGPFGAAAGAIGAISAPWLVSSLVANPEFVREMRQYAIQRTRGREGAAQSILRKKIVPIAVHEYKQLEKVKKQKEDEPVQED